MTSTQTKNSASAILNYSILCKIQPPYYENKQPPSKVSTYHAYRKMKEQRAANYKRKKSPIQQKSGGNDDQPGTIMFFG